MKDKKNIYKGKFVNCWRDDTSVSLDFPWCAVNLPIEEFDETAEDLCAIAVSWANQLEVEEEAEPQISGWEKQLEEILEKEGVAPREGLSQERIELFTQYFEKSKNIPSSDWQDYFMFLFTMMVNTESIPSALTFAFRLGQSYQENKEELEAGLVEQGE